MARRKQTKRTSARRPTKAKAVRRTRKNSSNVFSLVRKAVSEFTHPQKVSPAKLFDLLSEFLAVEQGGVQLYSVARDRTTMPDVRATFEDFLQQTEKYVDLLTGAIRDLGGNPLYVSPGAEIQQQRVQSMMDLKVAPQLRQIVDVENLLLAETKCHADWEFLGKISSSVEDPHAQDILRDIVSQVEDQEDEHVEYSGKALSRLMLIDATQAKRQVKQKRRAA